MAPFVAINSAQPAGPGKRKTNRRVPERNPTQEDEFDDVIDHMRLSCSGKVSDPLSVHSDRSGNYNSTSDFSISMSYRRSTWIPVWLERFRLNIFLIFECANSSTVAKFCSIAMLLSIVASIFSFVLESMPHFQQGDRAHSDMFWYIDLFFTVLFSTEYVLRLWVCDIGGDTRFTFMARPLNICDLIAVLPFYIELFMMAFPMSGTTSSAGLASTDIMSSITGSSCADILSVSVPSSGAGVGSQIFKVLRIVRLSRVFRLFKLSRYFKALSLLATTFRLSAGPLLWAYVILLFATMGYAVLMYFAEGLHCPSFSQDQESTFMSYSDTCQLASHFSNFTGYIAVDPTDPSRYDVLRPHTPPHLQEFCCQFWCQGKSLREVVSGMCALVLAPEGFEFTPICHPSLHIAHHTWASSWYLNGYVRDGIEPHIDDFWV